MSLDIRIKRAEPLARSLVEKKIAVMEIDFMPTYFKGLGVLRSSILDVCPEAADLCAQLVHLNKPIESLTEFELILLTVFRD